MDNNNQHPENDKNDRRAGYEIAENDQQQRPDDEPLENTEPLAYSALLGRTLKEYETVVRGVLYRNVTFYSGAKMFFRASIFER